MFFSVSYSPFLFPVWAFPSPVTRVHSSVKPACLVPRSGSGRAIHSKPPESPARAVFREGFSLLSLTQQNNMFAEKITRSFYHRVWIRPFKNVLLPKIYTPCATLGLLPSFVYKPSPLKPATLAASSWSTIFKQAFIMPPSVRHLILSMVAFTRV